MKIIIRTDASQKIGSGHVMRCINLAEGLRDKNVTVEFITRNHQGNINEQIKNKGFKVYPLPPHAATKSQNHLTRYEKLLGVTQLIDADDTIQVLSEINFDCLIVDHYALDYLWEGRLRAYSKKIMVIDDLANRNHDCDILLDQNYIHDKSRYDELISLDSIKLLGPKYALLQKDFIKNRKNRYKSNDRIKKVFVFFGGADLDNLTCVTIKALSKSKLRYLSVDVVIGSSNPHHEKLKAEICKRPNIKLHIQIDNMAELMSNADISIGAGGTTTWERMALGLPSIVVTLADNQISFIRYLDKDGCLNWLGGAGQISEQVIYSSLLKAIQKPYRLHMQSQKNQKIVDGMGVNRVANILIKYCKNTTYLEKEKFFSITILSDSATWIKKWIRQLVIHWKVSGHKVVWVHEPEKVPKGDFCFILGCSTIINSDVLSKNNHNLVVHESDLPKGRGWSPLSWQVLEGKRLIPITLFEAINEPDGGVIYIQDKIEIRDDELVDDLREKQAVKTLELCKQFVGKYPEILSNLRVQKGNPSFYPKRAPIDSVLDVNKTISEQFNLLRIADNDKYPAYFKMHGYRYELSIKKSVF